MIQVTLSGVDPTHGVINTTYDIYLIFAGSGVKMKSVVKNSNQ